MHHHLKVEPSVGQGRRSPTAMLGLSRRGRALWTPAANNSRNMSQHLCYLIVRRALK